MVQGRLVRLSLGAAAGFALSIATPLFGQEAAPAPAAEPAVQPKPGGVEEIIVTATKREANIQEIPIAVSAFQGDELTERGIDEVEDLTQVSPSIQINTSNSASNGGTLRIRGMGTTGNNPGLEAAVGTFIDGVYRSRAGQGFSDLLDIERVEILRGPQGTLFGKNTSAGAVSVITKSPSLDEGEGFAQVEYGNFDHKRVAASYSAPIIDGILGFRLSAGWSDRDGFYEDANGPDAWAERDRYMLRGQLLWEPTENFSARLIGDYGQRDESCCPAQYTDGGPSISRLTGGGTPATGQPYAGIPFAGNGIYQLATAIGLGRDVPFIASPITNPAGCIGVGPDNTAPPPIQCIGPYPHKSVGRSHQEKREVGVNYAPFEDIVDWGVSLEMNWDFDWAKMTSITSWRDFHAKYGEDIDFGSADILRPQQDVDDIFQNFAQELRLAGSWEDLDWLVGIYAYTEDLHSDERLELGTQAGQFVFGAASALVNALPLGAGYGAAWNVDTSGYALFSNNTYHFTDKLSVTGGVRYSSEHKEARGDLNGSPVAVRNGKSTGYVVAGTLAPIDLNDSVQGLNPDAVGWCEDLQTIAGGALAGVRATLRGFCDNASWVNSSHETEVTGTASISYAVTDDINVYASYSRGYKAGGFNLDQESVDVIVCPNALPTCPTAAADPNNAVPIGFISDHPNGGNVQTGLNPITGAPAFGIQDESHFDPEFANAYEIGIKGVYLDGMARINIAGFWTDFQDFQLNTFNGLGFIISNVDDVRARGAELEMYLFPVDGVTLSFGTTYADTRYGDKIDLCFPLQFPDGSNNNCEANNFTGVPGGNDTGPQAPFAKDFQAKHYRITNAPAWSGSMSLYAEHAVPSTEWMGYLGANVSYKGRHNTGSNLHPLKFEEHHYFLNMNVGVRSPDTHWDASFWATNLTDEYERTVVFDSVFQGGSFGTYFNAPRMYGATLKYNF